MEGPGSCGVTHGDWPGLPWFPVPGCTVILGGPGGATCGCFLKQAPRAPGMMWQDVLLGLSDLQRVGNFMVSEPENMNEPGD